MKRSIYYKNFSATALIVFISFLVLGCLSTAWSYRIVMSAKRETMRQTLSEAAWFISMQSMNRGFDLEGIDLRIWLSMTAGVTGFDLLLCDPDGVVVSCSDRELVCPHMGKQLPDNVLVRTEQSPGGVLVSDLDRMYLQNRYTAGAPLTVRINGELITYGYLFLSSHMTELSQSWRQFTGVFSLIAVCVLAITFIITFATTKKQAEPLKAMAAAARRFAHGDFSSRVEETERYDEICELAASFNAMADSLENSEKLRREFIANISHELKTPMTVIAGFADGILDGTIPVEDEARYLGVISSETRRLSRLVKGMLDMSRLQPGEEMTLNRESFDITETARLTLLSLGGRIEEKGLDVEAELPEEAIMTRGDKDAITQVIYNLIDNAVKFSNPGAIIKLNLWKQGAKVFVAIENEGETIPQDELPLIFDRFHKTDKSRSANRDGVGLGLYIVKTILDSHNEDIFVTSRDSLTKFVFTLTTTNA